MAKHKMKTNSSAKKRFRVTKNGKVIGNSAGSSHLLEKKTRKHKRRIKQKASLTGAEAKRIKTLLGK